MRSPPRKCDLRWWCSVAAPAPPLSRAIALRDLALTDGAQSRSLAERARPFGNRAKGDMVECDSDVLPGLSKTGVDAQDCFRIFRTGLAEVTPRRHSVVQD
jgi:hypothetical protein